MKKKLRIIFYLFIFMIFIFGNICQAKETEAFILSTFYKASLLFDEGKYEQAKAGYESILNSRLESGNLYYNLANTYFKLGKLGKAIVNYERAKRLMPKDSDLEANLEFAFSHREHPITPQRQIWIIRLLQRLADQFSLNRLTVLGSSLYFLLALLLGIAILFKKELSFLKYIVITNFILMCIFGGAWGLKFHEERIRQYAILIVTQSDCRFAPSENAVTHFRLYEGAKVRILNNSGEWLRIKTPDAQVGWIKSKNLETI